MPPLAQPWNVFTGDFYKKSAFFCRFPAKIAKFNNVWRSFFIPIQYAIKIVMWDCIWYDAVIFWVFKFQKKMGKFASSIERSKAKNVSASGGFAPWPPTRGSAPGFRWGPRPQTSVISSRSARSPCPPLCQILNTPLSEGLVEIRSWPSTQIGYTMPRTLNKTV